MYLEPIIVVTLLGAIIFLLLVLGAPIKPLRFIGQGMIKLIIGALFLFFLNAFGSVFDYHIPINLVTASVSGFLGIPGLIVLVAIDFFVL
jgi:inhibitor of the pro-sigma K processing machinery